MKYTIVLMLLIFSSCSKGQDLVAFPAAALQDTFINVEGTQIVFSEILEKHKGQTILIDIWASWCRDCIVGMPKVKALQAEFKDVTFLFLSLDKSTKSWKKGIEKYKVAGEHYFMSSGWKGAFSKAIDLDWIPRYMVVDPTGKITVYRAVEATDYRLKEALLKD